MTLVIAADLSLSSTGLAMASWAAPSTSPRITVWSVGTEPWEKVDGDKVKVPMPARHAKICASIFGPVDANRSQPVLVVKEQRLSAAGHRQPGSEASAQDLAGLHAVVEYGLFRRGVPFVDVPGPTLKKYATGRHQCPKRDVYDAARDRLEHLAVCGNNDEADALWLLVMGCGMYGVGLVEGLPVVQQIAADKLAWPIVGGHKPRGVADAVG